MKTWYAWLLILVNSFTFAQNVDRGYLFMNVGNDIVYIPFKQVLGYYDYDILLRAAGGRTEPIRNNTIFSLALFKLSGDSRDLDLKRCWLTVDYMNQQGEEYYLSFGFKDSIAFFALKIESEKIHHILRTVYTKINISKIENFNNHISISGKFAAHHITGDGTLDKEIEIYNGRFMLLTDIQAAPSVAATDQSEIVKPESLQPTAEFLQESTTLDFGSPYSFIVPTSPSTEPESTLPSEFSSEDTDYNNDPVTIQSLNSIDYNEDSFRPTGTYILSADSNFRRINRNEFYRSDQRSTHKNNDKSIIRESGIRRREPE